MVFKTCPMCEEEKDTVRSRRQNTNYHDDQLNFITCCASCFRKVQEHWLEMWRDYHGMIDPSQSSESLEQHEDLRRLLIEKKKKIEEARRREEELRYNRYMAIRRERERKYLREKKLSFNWFKNGF